MCSSSHPGKLVGSVRTGHRARIVIADDHILVAEACKRLLEPEFRVVGIVTNGRMLVERLSALQPDVVILETSMPALNGLDAGEQIKSANRDIKLVYLTIASAADVAAEAFRRGASGYVLKQGNAEELRIAVRRVLRGESYLSPLIDREQVLVFFRFPDKCSEEKRISVRQKEVLQLLVEGKSMKEIGYILQIKPGTVAFHKYRLMNHLRIRTSFELISYAIRHHVAAKEPLNAGW